MNKNWKCSNRQEVYQRETPKSKYIQGTERPGFFYDAYDALGKVESEGEASRQQRWKAFMYLSMALIFFFSPQSFEDSLKVLELGDGITIFVFASSHFGGNVAKAKLQIRRWVGEKKIMNEDTGKKC